MCPHPSSQVTDIEHCHGRSRGHLWEPRGAPELREQKSLIVTVALCGSEHFVERYRCLVTPLPCLHVPYSLTALQRGSSWLSTKGKKMQSCHPRTNLLRAEPLSDWNFCTTHTVASPVAIGAPRPTSRPSPQTSPSARAP